MFPKLLTALLWQGWELQAISFLRWPDPVSPGIPGLQREFVEPWGLRYASMFTQSITSKTYTTVSPGEWVEGWANTLVPIHVGNKHQVTMTHKLPTCAMSLALLFHLLLNPSESPTLYTSPKQLCLTFLLREKVMQYPQVASWVWIWEQRAVKASRPS